MNDTSISGTLFFYKKPGETPLQALDRLRIEKPTLKDATLSYAGRLDPLAEGQLLVLIGEACKDRKKYLGLDKTYSVDILFGVSTDTGDVLGKIINKLAEPTQELENLTDSLQRVIPEFIGIRLQRYPLYSSKPYRGKALFEHARSGNEIDADELPQKEVSIYLIVLEKIHRFVACELDTIIKEKISSVSGDFRQQEIMEGWHSFFSKNTREYFNAATIKVHCSSGTYMRVLAEEIGTKLGIPALALHIKRDEILMVK